MGQASFSDGLMGTVRGIARWEIRDRGHAARQAILSTTRDCMMRFSLSAVPADAGAPGLCASDEVCGHMQRVVGEYAYILRALGHEPCGAADLIVQAVRDAAGPDEPPPGMLAAVRAWSLEAVP